MFIISCILFFSFVCFQIILYSCFQNSEKYGRDSIKCHLLGLDLCFQSLLLLQVWLQDHMILVLGFSLCLLLDPSILFLPQIIFSRGCSSIIFCYRIMCGFVSCSTQIVSPFIMLIFGTVSSSLNLSFLIIISYIFYYHIKRRKNSLWIFVFLICNGIQMNSHLTNCLFCNALLWQFCRNPP